MDISQSTSQVNYYSDSAVTRRQLQQALPDDKALTHITDQFSGETVGAIADSLESRRAKMESKSNTGKILTGLGVIGAVASAFTFALPVTVAVAGLGAVGAVIAMVGHKLAGQASDAASVLHEKAKTVAETLVKPDADGVTFQDHRFYNQGVFEDPKEIRETGSGEVRARQVHVNTKNPMTISEDVATGKIKIESKDSTVEFPGSLTLPGGRDEELRVVRDLPNPSVDEDAIKFSVLTVKPDGEVGFHLSGDSWSDEDGFSYAARLDVTAPKGLPQKDGTVYLQNYDEGWLATKSPVPLGALGIEAAADAGTVSRAGKLDGLEFHYAAQHPQDLAAMDAQPVVASKDVQSITYSPAGLRFEPRGQGWEISNAAGQKTAYEGKVGEDGELSQSAPPRGRLVQNLKNQSVELRLAQQHSTVKLSHEPGKAPEATFSLSPDHKAPAVAELQADGSYKVSYGDTSVNIQPIVSQQLLTG